MSHAGEIAALATAFCFSLGAIIFGAVGRVIGSLQLNLLRLPSAALFLGGACLVLSRHPSASLKPALILALSGAVGQGFGDILLYASMNHIGPRLSMLIVSLAPPMAAGLAYFFLGESLSFMAVMGMLVTVAGVSWVVSEKIPGQGGPKRPSAKGIALAAGATAAAAVALVLTRLGMVLGIDPLLGAFIRVLGASAFVWLLASLMGRVENPGVVLGRDPKVWKLLLSGVILVTCLGMWLYLVSLKLTKTGVAATIIAIVPVMMIPMVVVIYKERPSLRAVSGAVVAVLGVAMLFWR